MNARIQELIAQATTAESYYPAGCNGYHEDRYWFDKEKFAELLVEECARICDALQNIPATEPRHCAEDIRIHFGVFE